LGRARAADGLNGVVGCYRWRSAIGWRSWQVFSFVFDDTVIRKTNEKEGLGCWK